VNSGAVQRTVACHRYENY